MASVEHVRTIFETTKATHGFLKPSGAAVELITHPQENPELVAQTRSEIYGFKTEPFLYPDVAETVQAFRREGPVFIWTDDYPERVLTSGLLGSREENLQPITLETAVDKMPLLPGLFQRAQHSHAAGIVVIDNNIEELQIAVETARRERFLPPVQFVWRTNEASEALPWNFPITDLPLIRITTLSELLDSRIKRTFQGKLQWIIDFNETLLNTPRMEQAMHQHFAARLNGHLAHSSE